jgi:hypothetical protein
MSGPSRPLRGAAPARPVAPRGVAQPHPAALRGVAHPGPAGLPGAARARPVDVPGAARPRDLLAGAVAAAGSFLLEPADASPGALPPSPPGLRPVVAVFGLARGCGVTVVARALAAELARRDPGGAAAVHCEVRGGGIPLATQPATRLARALADVPGAGTRAVGRICLVEGAEPAALADTARHLAPLALDAGSTSLGGVPAALADRAIVVATAAIEPALAEVASACLRRLGHDPIVVLNRARPRDAGGDPAASGEPAVSRDAAVSGDPAVGGGDAAASGDAAVAWATRAAHRLPESRMGAQLALGGREARGELGRAIAELADLCGVPR